MAMTFRVFKIIGLTVLFLCVFVAAFIALMNLQSCKKIYIDDSPVPVKDTVLDIRYYETVKHDTVIKLIEKPFYIKGEPVLIEYKKIDTVFLKQAAKLDLVMHLKKSGNRIEATTINFNDTLLKKTLYINVGNDFSLTSQADKVYIKSKRFYFNGLNASLKYDQPIDDVKTFKVKNFSAAVTSGLNYMDMFHFDAGLEYNANAEQIFLTGKLTYRFFK